MSGPSDKAMAAMAHELSALPSDVLSGAWFDAVQKALVASHDPALGLDRSVCLRDVVETLRQTKNLYLRRDAADFIEREFTEADRG